MTQHLALFPLCFLNLCFVWNLPHFKMLADACCWKTKTPPQTWVRNVNSQKVHSFEWRLAMDPFFPEIGCGAMCPWRRSRYDSSPIFPSFLRIDFLGWESLCEIYVKMWRLDGCICTFDGAQSLEPWRRASDQCPVLRLWDKHLTTGRIVCCGQVEHCAGGGVTNGVSCWESWDTQPIQ